MHWRGGWPVVAVFAALFVGLATQWSGCGGDGGTIAVTFQGDVASVTGASAKAPARSRFFASVGRLLDPQAIAQGTCPAKRVLICAATGTAETTPTPTSTVTPTATTTPVSTPTATRTVGAVPVHCERVNSDTCGFSLQITLAEDGDEVVLFFVDDADGNGSFGSSEKIAELQNPLGRVCNGDLYTLEDVDVNFTSGNATATFVNQEIDACAPTPGPTSTRPTATPTGTRPTATPTVTGTPPTPTPTNTSGPSPTPTSMPSTPTPCPLGICL